MALKQLVVTFPRSKLFKWNHITVSSGLTSYIRCVSSKPVFQDMHKHCDNIAVVDNSGTYTYRDILHYSHKLYQRIVTNSSSPKNIILMCPNDASYIGTLIACWLSGNTAVPLCKDHPLPMLEYYVKDSQSVLAIVNKTLSQNMEPIAAKLGLPILEVENPSPLNRDNLSETEKNFKFDGLGCSLDQDAMIIYTSGTTGPPKGVVLTHGNFRAQVSTVLKAWEWTSSDAVLQTLPLHHIHGVMYATLCPLDAGASIVMLPKFDAGSVWKHLLDTSEKSTKVNMFFGVPTMYTKLLAVFEEMAKEKNISKENCRKICMEKIRLFKCGSAALPEPVFSRWEEITGHKILERYGSTEVGMPLSNPLHGARIPGSVGTPLPGVGVCISKSDDCEHDVLVHADGEEVKCGPGYNAESGNLLIKGPSVFKRYWNKPNETKETFAPNGWFKTGDTASYENGYFRILGRTSVDIIKSGGFKISALDVERELLSHPDVIDCTVIGIPDDTWGEKVVAYLVMNNNSKAPSEELKKWCKNRLPHYCVPSIFKFVPELARNTLGKVNKKELKATFSP